VLTIHVPLKEAYNEETQKFVLTQTFTMHLEHSLVSLSKWESEFERPFLGDGKKSAEELLWYIQAMTLTPNVPPEIFDRLSEENIEEINAYLARKMTATTVNDQQHRGPQREKITAELIYYWMIALNIPFECQYWHINKLMMLIRVCNHKNNPPKTMTRRELINRNRQLNAQRRAQYGTTG
jgi:hypothetical protein